MNNKQPFYWFVIHNTWLAKKNMASLGSHYGVNPHSLTHSTPLHWDWVSALRNKKNAGTSALSPLPPPVSQNFTRTDMPSPRLRPARWHDEEWLRLRKLGIRITLMSTCGTWTGEITHSFLFNSQEIRMSNPVRVCPPFGLGSYRAFWNIMLTNRQKWQEGSTEKLYFSKSTNMVSKSSSVKTSGSEPDVLERKSKSMYFKQSQLF